VAASLTHLAAIRREDHQYGEAETLLQRALNIDENALGPEHSEVFKTLSNLATAYYFDGRYQDAEPIFLRALKVGEQSLGPAHPDVITTLADYAALLRKLKRKNEARKIEARMLELRAKSESQDPARFEVDWRDLQHPAHYRN
jgi:tetratricopeptide (TPR) repeat protein